jgi:hypothetical protein
MILVDLALIVTSVFARPGVQGAIFTLMVFLIPLTLLAWASAKSE